MLRAWNLKYDDFPTVESILANCPFDCSEEQREWARSQLKAAMKARSNAYWGV